MKDFLKPPEVGVVASYRFSALVSLKEIIEGIFA